MKITRTIWTRSRWGLLWDRAGVGVTANRYKRV